MAEKECMNVLNVDIEYPHTILTETQQSIQSVLNVVGRRAGMSISRRENSLYKHKYRELLKAVEDIKQDIYILRRNRELTEVEYIRLNLLIDKHIGKEQE